LSYQWLFNETNVIAGATNATLTLSNVQFTDAGNYSVIVTNAAGSTNSSNASLIVVFPPAVVRLVGNNNATAGSTTVVPLQLVANGNENALSLSINYNTNLLAFNSVVQGSNAANASVFYNTSQTNSGRIGLLLGLGAGQTFAPGTQEVALVSFDVIATPAAINRTATLTFGNSPTPRQLSDVAAVALSAYYSNANLIIPAAEWEADTAPRVNGDKVVSATDWVQVGRFVAHLDAVNDGGEYQRADCAPRGTLGNGVLSITDWVQAGRYAAGLDPLTVVGGPTSETLPELLRGGKSEKPEPNGVGERTLRVVGKAVQAAVTNTITVELDAQGNENALGFSLHFDPEVLQFAGVSAGSGTSGSLFNLNVANAASGDLGIALALPTGVSFTPGTVEVARISFVVAPTATSSTDVVFANNPVRMEVSDAGANTLATSYVPGSLTINPFPPVLRIGKSGEEVTLSWPVTASNFVLQASDAVSGDWTNAASPMVIGSDNVVPTPATNATMYFRLFKP
jgi:hypothetical protein